MTLHKEMSTNSSSAQLLDHPMSKISEPHENDILLGRGGVTHYHLGNSAYRQIVNINKPLYASLKKSHKTDLSKGIVQTIRSQSPPGRFLQFDKQTGFWNDIGDKKAIEKTSQALREGQPHTKEKLNTAPSMVPEKIPTTAAEFVVMIKEQSKKISLQTKEKLKKENAMQQLGSPQPTRVISRMNGSRGLTNQKEDASMSGSLATKRKSMTSFSSDVSMFSNNSSTNALFARISKQNLSLCLADCTSQFGSNGSGLLDEDMKSKISEASDNRVVVDFREHFQKTKQQHVSDLTCSLSKMDVATRNAIFKDSDGSIDSSLSMTSAFKNYLNEQVALQAGNKKNSKNSMDILLPESQTIGGSFNSELSDLADSSHTKDIKANMAA